MAGDAAREFDGHAAVHYEGFAGDEAGGVGDKEEDGVGDVLGVVAVPDGVLAGLVGVEFGGGCAGGGFVFGVCHDAGGPDARIRRGSVR